jgi:hypothetical protein
LCDHVQEVFRSGTLNDVDQNRALASELQGMMDVAEPGAAQVRQDAATLDVDGYPT